MNKTTRIVLLSAVLLFSAGLRAQNMSSSPYSRYAYGDMNEIRYAE